MARRRLTGWASRALVMLGLLGLLFPAARFAASQALILEIDNFGGRVDATMQIRDALLNTPLRTVGFVNKRAISAGALIGLATQTLVMATGSTIGGRHCMGSDAYRAAPAP